MNDINGFQGEFDFLSNFYPCLIKFEGDTYPGAEHAFQAAKTLNSIERKAICNAGSAGKAKRLGRLVKLRKNWETVKDSIMLNVLRLKFKLGSPLARQLLDTGNRKLIEKNTWGDTYWGVYNDNGKNKLGQLLMQVRQELLDNTLEKDNVI
ncbi:MAG: NADAR family protein [Bacteroidota bacterium]